MTTSDSGDPQIIYSLNQTARNNPPIQATVASTHALSLFFFYDIINCTAYDTSAEAKGTAAQNSVINNAPSITPLSSPGIIICEITLATGPFSKSVDPSNQILDSPFYTGSSDGSHLNSGTANLHLFNANTSPVNFGGQLNNSSSTSWNGIAVEFH